MDGDITNRLPSAYTVMIAEWGTKQLPGCSTWNEGWYSCSNPPYWLPSGKSDGEIRSPGFDTDGFMVENRSYRVRFTNRTVSLAAGTWTAIDDFSNVNCFEAQDGPERIAYCDVDEEG